MSKRVIFEETDEQLMSEFCRCDKPNYVDNEIHQQYGGEIVSSVIGQYCTNCKKDKAPVAN